MRQAFGIILFAAIICAVVYRKEIAEYFFNKKLGAITDF